MTRVFLAEVIVKHCFSHKVCQDGKETALHEGKQTLTFECNNSWPPVSESYVLFLDQKKKKRIQSSLLHKQPGCHCPKRTASFIPDYQLSSDKEVQNPPSISAGMYRGGRHRSNFDFNAIAYSVPE